MIVVDTNVIAYLLIPGDHSESARAAFRRDPEWSAPLLWRSELRSVLSSYMRARQLSVRDAIGVQSTAESVMRSREYTVDSAAVLRCAAESRLSSCDCEFVALAQAMRVPLVTSDRRLLREAPGIAIPLSDFSGTS